MFNNSDSQHRPDAAAASVDAHELRAQFMAETVVFIGDKLMCALSALKNAVQGGKHPGGCGHAA